MLRLVTEPTRRPRPGNYAQQARTYDYTRGASPTVVRTLAKYLGDPAGRSLLDIAGGTGNYAQVFAARGFDVVVVDASLEMLDHAARKLGRGMLRGGRCPGLADRPRRRRLRPDRERRPPDAGARGRLSRGATGHPGGAPGLDGLHGGEPGGAVRLRILRLSAPLTPRPPAAAIEASLREAGFSTVESETFLYSDTVDGSLNALHVNALASARDRSEPAQHLVLARPGRRDPSARTQRPGRGPAIRPAGGTGEGELPAGHRARARHRLRCLALHPVARGTRAYSRAKPRNGIPRRTT